MPPGAVAVVPLEPYVVRVLFADGRVNDVDIEPILDGPVFRPLRDPERFAQVYVGESGAVTWPGDPMEVDLAPETVYGENSPRWETKIRVVARL